MYDNIHWAKFYKFIYKLSELKQIILRNTIFFTYFFIFIRIFFSLRIKLLIYHIILANLNIFIATL